MATSVLPLLLLVSLLATTAAARPCKTIFYFSATTTTTYYPFDSHHDGNPNPNSVLRSQNPRYLTLIFTTTTTSRFPIRRPSLVSSKPPGEDSQPSSPMMTSSDFPLKFVSSVSSSIRDLSKDIMTVMAAVAALLLGVACGALSAFAMYFVWVLLSRRRRFDFEDDYLSSSDDDDDDDVTVAKKFGYVAIPAKPKLADDDLKKPAPPAKEVV
ncbi:hypothetical protein DH2020_020869 [Rehmannia glutinosa]|uniref:Uncharacterized protein n=1 Tax=Rehmannia glutinosa TaxID=99300 RepID=A0ABR0WD84_REHGL